MAFRCMMIESPAHLSLRRSQLIIKTDREYSVAAEDISALLLESRQSTITTAALSHLGQCGCAVFVCDTRHIPCAVALPYAQHSRHLSVIKSQMGASLPLKKRLWQSLVVSKIQNQAQCLRLAGKEKEAEGLHKLSLTVRSGDPDNKEATAAARYFPALFGQDFTRGAETSCNAALNYGYAILRGCVARNLAVYGFIPALGLHHCSELNAFNLADDLMEPFRPLIDLLVFMNLDEQPSLSQETKRFLFNCLNLEMRSGGQMHSVAYAAERLVQSLTRSLTDATARLCLPELTGIKQHDYE